MHNSILVALSKGLAKKIEGITIEPGNYAIKTKLEIELEGSLYKGEPVEYVPTIDIPLLQVLALVLQRMGFQRERASELLIEAMQEAIAEGNKVAIAERVREIEKAMEHVRSITASLPKKVRTGPTTAKVAINVAEVLTPVKTEIVELTPVNPLQEVLG